MMQSVVVRGEARPEEVVRELALALHRAGLPSHRVEDETSQLAHELGLTAQVFVTPTAVFVAFGDGSVQLCRSDSRELDLGRLVRIDEGARALRAQIAADVAAAQEGDAADETLRTATYAAVLDKLALASEVPHWAVDGLAYGALGASAVILMGGGWVEAAIAVLCGWCVGGLGRALACGGANAAQLFVVAAACLATLMATVVASLVAVDVNRLTVAGLIVLVPGLSVTTALTELARGHLVSGSARLASVTLTLLQMGVGVALGGILSVPLSAAVVQAWPSVGSGIQGTLPAYIAQWWEVWLGVLAGAAALNVAFRGPWQLLPAAAGVGLVAVYASRWVANWAFEWGLPTGNTAAAFAGAFAVGLTAHAFARLTGRPAMLLLLPGIIILVPGSVGLASVQAFVATDTLAGVEAAFRMAMTAGSLVVGLMLAGVVLPPRRHV